MKQPDKVYIAGVGIATPLGADSATTAAAVNAGLARINELDFLDSDYSAVRMADIPSEVLESILDVSKLVMPMTAQQYRMLQISVLALSELAKIGLCNQKTPLFLAGPECVTPELPSLNDRFLENVAIQSELNIDLQNSRILLTGRAGGLDVIDTAFKYFQSTSSQMLIVGGVDTFYDTAAINHYANQNRLLTFDSNDGFIPGEGAGFLLLVSENAPEQLINACSSYLASTGHGHEDGFIGSEIPCMGDGLSEAFRSSLHAIQDLEVCTIMSSMNGESYFAKELGIAIMRNRQRIASDFVVKHIAEYCGDLGAAMGPVMAGVLHIGEELNNGPGLIYASSDSSARSAVCIARKSYQNNS